MKKTGIIALAFIMGLNAMAQVFDKDTLAYSGSSDKHINLVILSDGYRSSELSKFVTDATNFTSAYFNVIPYSNYKKYFNVFIVKVPSNESGASHPGTATDCPAASVQPVITVDNYFGSTFDSYNIHRLLVANKTTAISSVLQANYPDYDIVLILVNSPYYGGSGGYYTVASTDPSSAEVAEHEIGHSFAGLHDEYWAGDNYAGEGINMTKQTDPSLVRWKNWIGVNLIGIYQHCCGGTSALWYRPHQNCKMRVLGPPFCSVCVQATVESIHSLVTPIESFDPQNNKIYAISYPVKFRLNLINPDPNTLKRIWLLNSLSFTKNVDSVSVNENLLVVGTNTLKVTVEDTTQLLRVDNHSTIHISSVTWSIIKSITGIRDITSSSSEINVDLYPNPASEFIKISLNGSPAVKIKIEIYDLLGQMKKAVALQASGVNTIDLHELEQGIYLVKVFVDNNLITTRKILKN